MERWKDADMEIDEGIERGEEMERVMEMEK